jgi:hypothetical protein
VHHAAEHAERYRNRIEQGIAVFRFRGRCHRLWVATHECQSAALFFADEQSSSVALSNRLEAFAGKRKQPVARKIAKIASRLPIWENPRYAPG